MSKEIDTKKAFEELFGKPINEEPKKKILTTREEIKEGMLEWYKSADHKKGNVIGIYQKIKNDDNEYHDYTSPHQWSLKLEDHEGTDLDLSFLKDYFKKIRSKNKKFELRQKLQDSSMISSFACGQSFGAYVHTHESIRKIINDEDTWFIIRSWVQQLVRQQHELSVVMVVEHLMEVLGVEWKEEDWGDLK